MATSDESMDKESIDRGEEEDPFVRLAAREMRGAAPSQDEGSSVPKEFRLTLSERAVARLQALRAKEQDAELTLRVRIHAGGCSGYRTEFSLDKRRTDLDVEVVQDGVRVLVDKLSAQTLGASSLDFESAPVGESFRLLADKAHNACGCGVSFAL